MVLWKGYDLRQNGIIVEKIPTITKGKKKIETIQIDGRSGFLTIDNNTYEPFSVNLECHCTDYNNLDAIKELFDGYGTLSFDGVRQYTAIVDNSIPFETIIPYFKKFMVSFLVNPIAEDIAEQHENLLGVESIDIETYSTIYPLIELECIGDISITINNQTFYLYNANGTYTLDCKNKVITDSNRVNASNIMNGDFPSFKPGVNNITTSGTITAFDVYYRKTYL